MNENDTLYEQIIKKLKNKKAVVFILLIIAVIITVSQFLGGLSRIGIFLFPQKVYVQEIIISMQPYNLIIEATKSPRMLEPIRGNIDDIQRVAQMIAVQIADAIQPERLFETTLEISKNRLQASHSLNIRIDSFEFVEANNIDLLPLFKNPLFCDPNCKHIDMWIRDLNYEFQPELVLIFKKEDIFSFNIESIVNHKTIRFTPNKTRIIIEKFKVNGTSPAIGEHTKTLLELALRKELETYKFIEISPLTQEDLRRKHEELKSLSPKPGKEVIDWYFEQYGVDFIVTGNLFMKTSRRFLGL